MKKILLAFVIIWLVGCGVVFLVFSNTGTPAPDMAAVNDAVMSGEDLAEILRREHDRMDGENRSRELRLQIFLYAYTGMLTVCGVVLFLYCERRVLAPFRKLRRFARDVAAGNLDIPLQMDRHGSFGAFTESFDLMREELRTARENERVADRSKKELVASLSHDIKTPISSIKAAAELMAITAKSDKEKSQLAAINDKAEQINTLITDMFHATLEELQALTVNNTEVPSTALPQLIQSADYKNKAAPFTIPDCIILADTVRLQQIFDNIIGNSYKYADTAIKIHSFFDGDRLAVEIADFGAGVPEDELPLILNKFYRGKNTESKSGYGLGLYISKYLLEQMSGDLQCENLANGFAVKIILKLAE